MKLILCGMASFVLYALCAQEFNTATTILGNLIHNVQFAFCRIPCFLVGLCIVGGGKTEENYFLYLDCDDYCLADRCVCFAP